jgi:hypothetical protein
MKTLSLLSVVVLLLAGCATTAEPEPEYMFKGRFFFRHATYTSRGALRCNVHRVKLQPDTLKMYDPGGDVMPHTEQKTHYPNALSHFPGLHGAKFMVGKDVDVWFCAKCRQSEQEWMKKRESQHKPRP